MSEHKYFQAFRARHFAQEAVYLELTGGKRPLVPMAKVHWLARRHDDYDRVVPHSARRIYQGVRAERFARELN